MTLSMPVFILLLALAATGLACIIAALLGGVGLWRALREPESKEGDWLAQQADYDLATKINVNTGEDQ